MRTKLPRAILLAGGASLRFGSDKAMAPFQGTTLVAHQVTQLLGVFARVLVVAKDPERLGLTPGDRVRLVREQSPVHAALIGITAGLRASDRELNYVVGVDMPGVVPALIRLLFARARGRDAVLRSDEAGRPQPLGAYYAKRALPVLEQHIAAERFRLMEAIAGLEAVIVPYAEVLPADQEGRSFWNVNTAEDLRKLESRFPSCF